MADTGLAAIAYLLNETGSAFQQEMKAKQATLDTLHSALRHTSSLLGDTRRNAENLAGTLKRQQLAQQRVSNLAHAREDEQHRLMKEQSHSSQPNPSSSWETELTAMLEAADDSSSGIEGMLPSGSILRARIRAVQGRGEMTRKMVQALKGRSRDMEVKYRRVVALCTGVHENEVDAVVDGLLKAVESEKDELEIGRVRRFLGSVASVMA